MTLRFVARNAIFQNAVSTQRLPKLLLGEGQAGSIYRFYDLSTLFQDLAGTIPATEAGQSVALIKDIGGNGLNLTQATEANRATLEQDSDGVYGLMFNGSSTFYAYTDTSIISGKEGNASIAFHDTTAGAIFSGLKAGGSGSMYGHNDSTVAGRRLVSDATATSVTIGGSGKRSSWERALWSAGFIRGSLNGATEASGTLPSSGLSDSTPSNPINVGRNPQSGGISYLTGMLYQLAVLGYAPSVDVMSAAREMMALEMDS